MTASAVGYPRASLRSLRFRPLALPSAPVAPRRPASAARKLDDTHGLTVLRRQGQRGDVTGTSQSTANAATTIAASTGHAVPNPIPSSRVRTFFTGIEESRFKALHASCRSPSHGVSGSLTRHCGKCCPMPPMSPSRLDQVRALLTPTAPHELMVWRLRLYCGRTVERTAHRSHKTVHSAFCGSIRCSECGCDPATVIDARAVGLAAEPLQPEPVPAPRKPTRAALERRIKELETEVARLQSS